MDDYDTLDIPSYFLCPISIQLMKDPVTVSTGITYDRQSIEKWLFSCNTATCPLTNLRLPTTDLTPNHTLRRLIQNWCALNNLDRIPTPKLPADPSQILKILNQANGSPESDRNCLQRLRSIVGRNESSRKNLQATTGSVEFLASVVRRRNDAIEAVGILHQMELSDSDLRTLTADDGEFVESLTHVLETGNVQSRGQAVMLLNSLFHAADPDRLLGSEPELYKQIARIISDRISVQVTKAGLKLLRELCAWGKNRIKGATNVVVWALVDTILETGDRRVCELALAVLDQICGCAEGRAELLRHAAGLAVVSKKILRVSAEANDRGVRILCWISRHAASAAVVEEMAAVGVAAKLCLVVQVESGRRTKERAVEILRRHSRVWKESSSCIPPHLLSSYPC